MAKIMGLDGWVTLLCPRCGEGTDRATMSKRDGVEPLLCTRCLIAWDNKRR